MRNTPSAGFVSLPFAFSLILWCVFAEFSSPGHTFYLLSLILYIPFFYSLRISGKKWLSVTIIFGILYNLIYFRWLLYPFQYTDMPYLVAILTVFAMSAALTTFLVVFAFIYVKIFKFKHILATASLFTALEILKGLIFTGFPWGDLSYNFAFNYRLIQIASIGGSYIITFFIFLTNLLLFDFFYNKNVKSLVVSFFIVLIFCAVNLAILHNSKSNCQKIANVKIAIIQGNVSEKLKLDEKNAEKILTVYINETQKIVRQHPDLIVWPESIYIKFLSEDKNLSNKLTNFLDKIKIPLITGIPSVDVKRDNSYKIYNSMYLFVSASRYLRYDKVHLVPFGEYTPLKKLFFFVNKIVPGEDFSKGNKLKLLRYDKFKIVPLICFEGIFPFQILHLCKQGGNILINISNEAWFGKTYALQQHLAANILRTVESGKYFVRCANTGISAVIHPNGKIINSLKPFTKGTIVEKICLLNNVSFYHNFGFFLNFLYFISVFSGIVTSNTKLNLK